ncbi:MAG: hypothetical protein ABSA52_01230 [Candidatus Binatia bacterium]
MHATDEVPRRASALEEILNRVFRLGKLGTESCVEIFPKSVEDGCRQVLRAGHRRRSRGRRLQLVFRRGRDVYLGAALLGIRERAQGRHVARAELAPIGEDGWKRGSDLGGAELQQTVTRAARKRVPQPLGERWLQRRRVVYLAQRETPVRSEDEANGERTHRGRLLFFMAATWAAPQLRHERLHRISLGAAYGSSWREMQCGCEVKPSPVTQDGVE